MTVLVTGGTGFVGSHLIEALQGQGVAVRAIVRSPTKAKALGLRDVEWIPGDLSDLSALTTACRGVTAIYHVAGVIAATGEADFLRVNHGGTVNLLRAAEPTGARFVLVSSLAAAGPSLPGQPHTGSEPARPVTAYGRSKVAAEQAVRASPVPWVIVRPPAVYGPRDREMMRVFQAARVGIAPVFGDGSQELSLVYGPDLALALASVGQAPAAVGGLFYAAHPERLTSAEVVRTIGLAVGRRVRTPGIPPWVGRPLLALTGAAARLARRTTVLTSDKANEFFQPAWTCDPGRLEQATGWRATTDLAHGAKATFDWYRAAGWL